MKIAKAEFIKSADSYQNCPPERLPEIAFAGRSNVGKSSLINSLLQRKNLAKISSTPGKTRTLNFFLVNNKFYFVDLPGYGFAKVSLEERKKWKSMVEGYIKNRKTLSLFVHILDIRHLPQASDIELSYWLKELGIPIIWVATKADKLSRSKQIAQRKLIAEKLGIQEEKVVLFSAKTSQGRIELWKNILLLLQKF